jgi:molybdate transport system substrate-binding protein
MTAQITALSSMATRPILAELARSYEQRIGRRVSIKSVGGVDAARRVRAGEPADVIVLASNMMEQLEGEGHIVSGSRTAFASSGIAIAVRSGVPRPSVDDEESVKQAILKADRFCYSTGPSGDHLKQLCERWGIAGVVSRRAVQAPPGVPVGALVARGDAELGFQQLSELLNVPGLEIVGPLPPEIQAVTVFSAGVSSMSLQPDQARTFIEYLTSPEVVAAKRRHGMQPA